MSKPGKSEPLAVIRRVNGEVDDVVITGDLFRMEQMDKDSWWVAMYRGDERVCITLRWDKKRREIVATVYEDGIGCTDDFDREDDSPGQG